jgi:hypothetical protein
MMPLIIKINLFYFYSLIMGKRIKKKIKNNSQPKENEGNKKGDINENNGTNDNYDKKNKKSINCKQKKFFKNTKRMLSLNNSHIIKAIKYFKIENKKQVEIVKRLFYNNVTLYISLKNPLNFPETKKKISYIKLLNPLVNLKNEKYIPKIMFVSEKNNEISESLLEKLKLNKKEEKLCDIIEFKEFKELMSMLKEYKEDLTTLINNYHMIILQHKYRGKLKNYLGEKYNEIDIMYFNNISKGLENEIKLIFLASKTSQLHNLKNDKLFKIKIGNCSEHIKDLYKKIKVNCFSVISNILSNSTQKHNR